MQTLYWAKQFKSHKYNEKHYLCFQSSQTKLLGMAHIQM